MDESLARVRCGWADGDALMQAYHDEEWGIPIFDSRALWEKLILDGFQAGLSWRTILYKREAFRAAFHEFDPVRIAAYTDTDVERLMNDAGIVRSRTKIEATVGNARAFLKMQEEGEDFSEFVWSFVEGKTSHNSWNSWGEIPTQTEASAKLSKALKKRGFKFVGPVIVYAWMQAVGMVNDHFIACYRHSEIRSFRSDRSDPG